MELIRRGHIKLKNTGISIKLFKIKLCIFTLCIFGCDFRLPEKWETPSWEMLIALVLCGLLATLAHLLLTRAMSIAEMSAIAPLDFVRLLFAAGIGFIWFSEVPDIWTALGAMVITGSAVYIARREALSIRNKGA